MDEQKNELIRSAVEAGTAPIARIRIMPSARRF